MYTKEFLRRLETEGNPYKLSPEVQVVLQGIEDDVSYLLAHVGNWDEGQSKTKHALRLIGKLRPNVPVGDDEKIFESE